MSSSTEPSPSTAPSRGADLGATISVAIGLGALAGGVAYAIMRYSYQRFYNEFGLTPDDVGPSSAAALTQSGVGVALFVALFAILPLTLALLVSAGCGRAVRGEYSRRRRRSREALPEDPDGRSPHPESEDTLTGSQFALELGVRIVAADLTFLAFVRATSGHWEHTQLLVLTIAVILLTSRWYAEHIQPATSEGPRGPNTMEAMLAFGRRIPRSPWILAALMTVVGATVLASSLPIDAERTALCVISHPTLRVRYVHTHRTFPGLGHVAVLRVRADPARAISTEAAGLGPLSKVRPHRFIYLGEAGGHEFLFAKKACQTLQIPDSALVVLTSPRATACHWWKQRSQSLPCE